MTEGTTGAMTDMRNTTTDTAGGVHPLHTTADTDLGHDPAHTAQDVTEEMKIEDFLLSDASI